MGYKIAVLVKQVPDTHNISGDVMKEDGTINRGVLPAIFNPEDLNALEMALDLRERFGGMVTVVTMGPPSAGEVLRQSLYRGADEAYLASDIKFAGSDTWATAYTLAAVIKKVMPDVQLVLAGRQAIDGDTAQVGPQVAEKMGFNQLTYVESVEKAEENSLIVTKQIEGGIETIEAKLPLLMTVTESANIPRPAEVRRMMKFRRAMSRLEIKGALKHMLQYENEDDLQKVLQTKKLLIPVITAADIDVDMKNLGLFGSPTKVKNIENVVLKKEETVELEPDAAGAEKLIADLKKAKILG